MKKLLLLVGMLLPFEVLAPPYSIDWYKIASGGGLSTSSQYSLAGTAGQHDAAAPLSGGAYSLTGGCWAVVSALQTQGAPTLYIGLSGASITVHWQNVTGWELQQNNDTTLPSGWSPNTAWTTSNGTNYLNLASPSGTLFFRLHSQ